MTKQLLPGLTSEETRKAVGWAKLIEVFDRLNDRPVYDVSDEDPLTISIQIDSSGGGDRQSIARVEYGAAKVEGSLRELRRAPMQVSFVLTTFVPNGEGEQEETITEFDHYPATEPGEPDEIIPKWDWYSNLSKERRMRVDKVINDLYKDVMRPNSSEFGPLTLLGD